jgi:hypothetical protein
VDRGVGLYNGMGVLNPHGELEWNSHHVGTRYVSPLPLGGPAAQSIEFKLIPHLAGHFATEQVIYIQLGQSGAGLK